MKKLILISLVGLAGLAALLLQTSLAGTVSININDHKNSSVVVSGGNSVNVNTISTGCVKGDGKVREEQRSLSTFTGIAVDGVFDVEITNGRKQKVVVESDKNILPHIQTEVRNGTLRVVTTKSICPTRLRLVIDAQNLSSVKASGAVDIRINAIDAPQFAMNMDGSGNLTASGQTAHLKVLLTGTGDLDTRDLKAREVSISLNGAGDAKIFASQRLDAQVVGTGDIDYYGNPGQVNKNIMGVGDITAH